MNGKVMGTLLALILGFSLVLSGCGTEKQAPIVIGGIFSITGPASYLGEPERNTLQMMVADINAKGGIKGRPVKAVIYDSEANVTKARLNAEKLITKDKALAIIGPSLTHTSMTVLEVTQKAKTPLISCAAGVGIVSPASERVWVFKTAQTDQMAVARIFQYLQKQGLTKVAIITVSTGFGVSGKKQLETQASKYGLEIVGNEVFGEKDTDMTPQLTKIRETDAQAVICWGTGPAPALVAKNMKQLGFTTILIQSHGAASKKFIELAGDAADGILLPAGKLAIFKQLPDTDPEKKVCQTYDDMYQKKYKAPASSFGGYAYDAFNILKMAVEKAGADKAKVRDAIENTKNYVGVSGVFNMSKDDHNGLTPDAFVMVKIEGGEFKLLAD
ncbi:MAG: ABC transporter substrate-binding protein [Syntrophobacterales bacterium]|jgi:branched-chain amino acid transport system substrate-binding protein